MNPRIVCPLSAALLVLIVAAASAPAAAPKEAAPPGDRAEPQALPKKAAEPERKAPERVEPVPLPELDPTQPSLRMREALEAARARPAETKAMRPAAPEVTVKGLVVVQGREPAAVLEIKGAGRWHVRAGSRVTVGSGESVLNLRVTGITEDGVMLEAEELKQTWTVR